MTAPKLDHKRALELSKELIEWAKNMPMGDGELETTMREIQKNTVTVCACYLDSVPKEKYEELLRLANARLMGKYGAHEALRDFIEKENRHD